MKPRLAHCPYCGASEPDWNGAYTDAVFYKAAREQSDEYLRGYAEGIRSATASDMRTKAALAPSDIPSPSPEQEVKHLAEQCATLVAENEDLRARSGATYTDRCANLNCPRGGAPLTVVANNPWPNPAEYDELTDELMRTTHGLLRITGGLEPDKTVARAIRAHALLLRLHSLAFPVERTNAKA